MAINIISLGKNRDGHHDDRLLGGSPHGSQVVNNHVQISYEPCVFIVYILHTIYVYSYINNRLYISYYILLYHIILYYIVLYYIILYYGINYNVFWCPRESSLLPPPSRPRMRKLLRRSAFTLQILLIKLKQTHLKTASPQCTSTGNMLYLQCGAPSVIS